MPEAFKVERFSVGVQSEIALEFIIPPPEFEGWVDIDASEDPYDEVLWAEVKEYLEQSGGTFSGGRYGMARELHGRNLDFLAPYCLGQVCHIVQLAITTKKIVVYHKKELKTVASALTSAPSETTSRKDIQDLNQLCTVIFRMLARPRGRRGGPDHVGGVRLDRLRPTLQDSFGLNLNEMNFQCAKLSELFKQEPLCTAFAVEQQGETWRVFNGKKHEWTDEIHQLNAKALAQEAEY